MMLRLFLVLAIAFAVLRFARGMVSGMRGANLPRADAQRRQPPAIDEADIIDAEFTDVTEPTEPTEPTGPRP